MKNSAFGVILGCALIVGSVSWAAGGKTGGIEDGSKVTLNYALTIDDELVETTAGKVPLEYIHGQGGIIPGLAENLAGLKPGEKRKITLSAEEAYGEIREEALQEYPNEALTFDFAPEKGKFVGLQNKETGQVMPGMIWEVREASVVINFNHPLAGKALTFDVEVLDVE